MGLDTEQPPSVRAYASFLAEDPVAGPSAAVIKALTESIKTPAKRRSG